MTRSFGARALAAALAFALSFAASAAEPMTVWGTATEKGVPPSFQAWHSGFEENGDYGESWFWLARSADGTAVFVLMAVTNLGLRTFDGSVDVQVYSAEGKAWRSHHEVKRDAIRGAGDRMDVTIGGAHAWGGGNAYHLRIRESDVSLDLDLTNTLPSYRFGDGRVTFYADASAEWTLGINAPRAQARGSVTIGGRTFAIDGPGYTDHGWATIKLPTFLTQWTSLRVFDPKYTLVLHRHHLTEKFGGGDNKFGVVGAGDKLVGATKNFVLQPGNPRPVGGPMMPTTLDVRVNSGGYVISGTVKELRFQDAIDVLAAVSMPVRVAIKAFYAKPYLLRYVGWYELDVTTPEGTKEHISGECLVEVDTY